MTASMIQVVARLTGFMCGVVIVGAIGLGAAIPRSAADGNVHWFTSPSGNIVCNVGVDGASCDIGEYAYDPPPRPSICSGRWADRINLSPVELAPGFGRCHSDTHVASGYPVLNYGDSIRSGPVVCTSTTDGIACASEASGHSFRLSRESYELH